MRYIILSLVFIGLMQVPQEAQAQRVKIEQIIKKNDKDEMRGCGIEVAATDGNANGIQMQMILYSLGGYNWDLGAQLVAGRNGEEGKFQQQEITNASVLHEDFGEINIIFDGKNVFKDSVADVDKRPLISKMLRKGFAVSYQTENKSDGYIEVPKDETGLADRQKECYGEMEKLIKEKYKEIHKDTKCVDDPLSC